MAMTAWTCPHCQSKQTHDAWCEACHDKGVYIARYQSWDVQISEHVLEHIADGLSTPLEIQKAMNVRSCYANVRGGFQLQFIAQRIRLLTNDTTSLARGLLKARAASMALDVIERGDTKDKLAALKGIQVLGDVVEHKGDIVTRHVVELHEGPPPKREP